MDRAFPEETGAPQVDKVMFHCDPAVIARKIGIGKVAGQHGIVVPQGRAEQDGPGTVDRQIKVRQMPRVAMIEPLWTAGARDRVAAMVVTAKLSPCFNVRGRRSCSDAVAGMKN
jgi:hypothetical protein